MNNTQSKEKYSEIEKRLYSVEFSSFCQQNIIKKITQLEKKRKNFLFAIFIVPLILLGISFLLAKFFGDAGFILNIGSLLTLGLVYLYKLEVRKTIIPKLLSFLGDFSVNDNIMSSFDVSSYLKSLEITPKYNKFSCDDRIYGTYNGINIDINEIHLEYESKSTSRKEKTVHTVFKGIFVKFKSLKKFEGRTIVKKDGLKIFNDKNRVNLEDPEFEKFYDVTATDQIEARYLLTPAFMNRLVILNHRGIGRMLTLSFEKDNVNLFISSSRDWFNLSIFQSLNDVENYRSVLVDLASILSIIDTMKFDNK